MVSCEIAENGELPDGKKLACPEISVMRIEDTLYSGKVYFFLYLGKFGITEGRNVWYYKRKRRDYMEECKIVNDSTQYINSPNKCNLFSCIRDYLFILFGSFIYAVSTILFIFPHSLTLGGTSGISVMLEPFIHFSPGSILMVINFSLIVSAFVLLGKEMGVKTMVGSALTAVFIGLLEQILYFRDAVVSNCYISAAIGAALIAVASGIMFYVGSSSGGTDVIALIIKKYSTIKIGKALLITDVLIVIVGGMLSGITIFCSSFLGLLIKTLGIDLVIAIIKKIFANSFENRQRA